MRTPEAILRDRREVALELNRETDPTAIENLTATLACLDVELARAAEVTP